MSPTASWSTGARPHAPGHADLALEPVEVLAALATAEPDSPAFASAFATALVRRESVAPLLIGLIEQLADAPVAGEADDDRAFRSACVLALLAQMREQRAYAPLLRLLRRPLEQIAALIGWVAIDDLPALLASVAAGRDEALTALARNRAASIEARRAAMCALVSLVGDERLARESLIETLRTIRLELGPDDVELVTSWVLCAVDLHPGELMAEIRTAFAQTLVDESIIALEEVEQAAARPLRSAMSSLRDSADLVDDAHALAMEWHGLLHAPEPAGADSPPPATVRREAPKVGRNDPCPCGSGRKYKKCCMAEA